jgi:predicted transcriptional regulator
MKKNYSINLDIELKSRLDTIAKSESLSSSSIINGLISEYVGGFKSAPEKVVTEPEPEWTEEEAQAWIKKMEKKHVVK